MLVRLISLVYYSVVGEVGHRLNTWSSAPGAILEASGNFRRWDLYWKTQVTGGVSSKVTPDPSVLLTLPPVH